MMKGCVLYNMFKIQNYLSFLPLENIKINEYPISSIGQKCFNIQYNNNIFLFENVLTSYKLPHILLTPNYFRMKREISNNNMCYYYFPYISNMNKKHENVVEILFRGNDTYANLKRIQNDLNLKYINNSCIKYVRRLEYNVRMTASTIIIPWVDTPTIPLYQILLQSLACNYIKYNIYDLLHASKMCSFKELYEIIDLLNIKTKIINNYLYCDLSTYDNILFDKILNFNYQEHFLNLLNSTVNIYDSLTEFIQKEVNI